MKSNYLRLAAVAHAVKRYESPLRVNVYQAVRSDIYALSYDEYWHGFRELFAETDVIAIGEPLVRAMAGLPPQDRRMRSEHCADYAQSHRATMRVLARGWRAALAFVLLRLGSCGNFAVCRGTQRARSLPLVRISSELLRRMCRSPPPAERTRSAGLLLSRRQGTSRKVRDSYGCRARTSQDGKRMHDDRDRARLVF